MAAIYEMTCGRVIGNRGSELLCNLLSTQFGIKARRLPVRYDDTVAEYLITVEKKDRIPADLQKSILYFVKGSVKTLIALDITKSCPCQDGEWAKVRKM
jgi:hypothetical protein